MPAPPPFRELSPGVVELRQGGGRLAFFGLPFFLAGLGIILTGLRVVLLPGFPNLGWGNLVLCIFGLGFLAIGSVLLFGRSWITFDIARGTIVQSHGLLVPMRRHERVASDFDEVLMLYQAADSDSAERFPIRLHPVNGKNLDVRVAADFAEAYGIAEFLARLLNLNLADSTTGHTLHYTPDRIGESLQQRLRRTPATLEAVARPADAKSILDESIGQVKISTPKTEVVVSRNAMQIGSQTIFAADILDVDCSAMDMLRGSARRAVEQQAEADGKAPSAAVERTAKLLEGFIKLLPSQGLTVKSRQGMFTFGEGLPVEELQYLRYVIHKTLVN